VEFHSPRRGRIHFTGMTLAGRMFLDWSAVIGGCRCRKRCWCCRGATYSRGWPCREAASINLPASRWLPRWASRTSSLRCAIIVPATRYGISIGKAVAKIDRLIVRENEDEFFVRHALILDTFAGAEQEEIFEEAVSVAASFVCSIQTQESLLDLLFVGAEAYCFTAGRGVGHVDRMTGGPGRRGFV